MTLATKSPAYCSTKARRSILDIIPSGSKKGKKKKPSQWPQYLERQAFQLYSNERSDSILQEAHPLPFWGSHSETPNSMRSQQQERVPFCFVLFCLFCFFFFFRPEDWEKERKGKERKEKKGNRLIRALF